ncbi:MAG TPA: phosphodiester glycosidase family protein [Phycisphaerales bacterium]|nr:phosphodiester glycosidase family protein [Phycisphaerales bacterium]
MKNSKTSAWLLLTLLLWAGTVLAETSAPASDPNALEQPVSVDHLPCISYAFYPFDEPRPIRVHVLEIDLSQDTVELAVVIGDNPPQEDRNAVRADPRKLAAHPQLMVFVNTNPWTPWGPVYPMNVIISGLAASDGVVRSPHRGVSVWTNKQGRAFIGDPKDAEIQEGVGGFQQILKAGQVIVEKGGPLHPRTAIGVNERGDRLVLAVADGRQPGFSEGMSLEELATLMSDLGCQDAANMDGGGSSVLGIVDKNNRIRILNRPPGPPGYLRPLPVILTIRHKQASDESDQPGCPEKE